MPPLYHNNWTLRRHSTSTWKLVSNGTTQDWPSGCPGCLPRTTPRPQTSMPSTITRTFGSLTYVLLTGQADFCDLACRFNRSWSLVPMAVSTTYKGQAPSNKYWCYKLGASFLLRLLLHFSTHRRSYRLECTGNEETFPFDRRFCELSFESGNSIAPERLTF